MDVMKNFSKILFEHWNRLFREVVESPFPKVFKKSVGVTLKGIG